MSQYDYKEIGQADLADVKIFIRQGLKDRIIRACKIPFFSKNFGLLLGSKAENEGQFIVHINEIVPLGKIIPYKNPGVFSKKKWEDIQNKIYNLYPGMGILGWYDLRSGWGAMLTQQERDIHGEFFTKDWHVLYLLDDINESDNFFSWEVDKLKPNPGYYLYGEEPSPKRLNKISTRPLAFALMALSVVLLVFFYAQYGLGRSGPNDKLSSLDKGDTDFKSNMEEQDPDKDAPETNIEKNPTNIQKDEINIIKENYEREIDLLKKNLSEKEDAIASLENEKIDKEASQEYEDGIPAPKDNDSIRGALIYQIKRGDNLYKISKAFYGREEYSDTLARVNRIKNQRAIAIGTYLVIPPIEEIRKED